jgi:hypothetical protein
MTEYRVIYRESERGWGSKMFEGMSYATLEEAREAYQKCNSELPDKCPDYYIQAEYIEKYDDELKRWIKFIP